MADLAQVEAAFLKADAAGDTAAAKVLADEVRRLRAFSVVKREGQVVKAPREQFVPSGEKPPNPLLENDPTSVLERFSPDAVNVGRRMFGRGLMDVGQGIRQIVSGDGYTKEKTQEQAQYKKDFDAAGGNFDPARLAGNLTATAPLNAIPGGQSMKARMLANAAAGGVAGGAMFTPEDESKLDQTMAGAGIGAAIPPAAAVLGKVGSAAYHGAIEPMFAGGQRAIKGRAYLDAAGNKADEIIELLVRNKQIVPGSLPTAGEAASSAGRAEMSSLQASAARAKPSEYLERADSQNAARIAAIDEFVGTPAQIASAKARREAAATPIYKRGEAAETWETADLKALFERPSMKAVLNRTERLLKEKDKSFSITRDKANNSMSGLSGEEAQTMKLAFDDVIKLAPKGGMDTAELAALKETRRSYIAWMENKFPDLKSARAVYKDRSTPINEMEVGTELRNKLVPALREDAKPRAGVFAGAVRESAGVVKDATGQPRFKELQDVLTKRSLQTVENVSDDLARADRNAEMARRGAAAGPDATTLATENLDRQVGGKRPSLMHRGVMLANAIISRLEGKVDKKLAAEMATEMLNPPGVAESLVAAQHRAARNKILAEQIMRLQKPLAVGAGTLQGAQ